MMMEPLGKHDIETAKGLGLFSMGLGLTELVAGRYLSDLLGLGRPNLVRAFGAREIAAGVMVLVSPDSPAGLWARIAGDAMDLAVLGSVVHSSNRQRNKAALATLLVGTITALDVLCATALQQRSGRALRTARASRVSYRPSRKKPRIRAPRRTAEINPTPG